MLDAFLIGWVIKGLVVLVGVAVLVRYFSKRKRADGEAVNWTPLESIGITLGIFFASQIVVAVVIGIILGATGWDSERIGSEFDASPALQFVFIAGIEAFTIGLLYWFMKRRQTPWRAIGWVKPKFVDIAYALSGFVVYFGVYTLVVFNLLTTLFPQVDTEQAQELGFSTATTGPELIFIFLSLVILPPLVEEILVRGFLFTGLRNKLPVIWAAIIASVVFGAAHLQFGGDAPLLWTAAADTFVLSLVLIALRHKTGSLWPGIWLHFIKNGLAFLALFIFKIT